MLISRFHLIQQCLSVRRSFCRQDQHWYLATILSIREKCLNKKKSRICHFWGGDRVGCPLWTKRPDNCRICEASFFTVTLLWDYIVLACLTDKRDDEITMYIFDHESLTKWPALGQLWDNFRTTWWFHRDGLTKKNCCSFGFCHNEGVPCPNFLALFDKCIFGQ